jgi:hypothetical protein
LRRTHSRVAEPTVNQLSGSGNANNREEDVLENDVVQECIALHPLTLTSIMEILSIMEI